MKKLDNIEYVQIEDIMMEKKLFKSVSNRKGADHSAPFFNKRRQGEHDKNHN